MLFSNCTCPVSGVHHNQDPGEQYQKEFAAIIQAYKDCGYLAQDMSVFLKIIGPDMVVQMQRRGIKLWGNAMGLGYAHNFIYAHESLLSDEFSPEERIFLLAHEVAHLAVHNNKSGRFIEKKKVIEEIACDIVAMVVLGKSEGARSFFQKRLTKLGDTNGMKGSHPWTSTRVWYATRLNESPFIHMTLKKIVDAIAKGKARNLELVLDKGEYRELVKK